MAPNDPTVNPNQDLTEATPEPVTTPEPAVTNEAPAADASAAPSLDMDAINAAVDAVENGAVDLEPAADTAASTDATPASEAPVSEPVSDAPSASTPEPAEAEPEAAAPADYTNTSDPIDNPAPAAESNTADSEAGFVDGDLTNEAPVSADAAPAEEPAVAANVVTAPGAKKSNKALYYVLAGVGILAIIVILIILIVQNL